MTYYMNVQPDSYGTDTTESQTWRGNFPTFNF